jgi:hypothetical protein
MLSTPDHDERARQQYVLGLKTHIGRKVRSGNRAIFEARAKPAFAKEHGRAPQSPDEIGAAMWQEPSYLMFSALNRSAQDA